VLSWGHIHKALATLHIYCYTLWFTGPGCLTKDLRGRKLRGLRKYGLSSDKLSLYTSPYTNTTLTLTQTFTTDFISTNEHVDSRL
jgi:hypothetical protein